MVVGSAHPTSTSQVAVSTIHHECDITWWAVLTLRLRRYAPFSGNIGGRCPPYLDPRHGILDGRCSHEAAYGIGNVPVALRADKTGGTVLR